MPEFPPPSSPLSLCVFDLDGTLIDSLPDLADSVRLMLAELGLPALSDDDVRPMIGDGVAALVRRALTAARGEEGDHASALRRFLDLYEPRATRLTRPYPDAEATLASLRAAGMTCAVCTNKPVGAARTILGALGLLGHFATVSGGDSYAVRKPDPEHVRLTVAVAGFHPAQAVMIGDHRNDMLAARGAGLRTIYARWGYGAPGMDEAAQDRADTISDIPAIIARRRS